MPSRNADSFRQRVLAREPLVSCFIKTPSVHATEILGSVGYDFVVIDAEHAPFDRSAIDIVLLAARAAQIAAVVRVPSADHTAILGALDCGASGVLVPHICSAEQATDVAAACRYRGGRRGYSNSPRAGGYGTSAMWGHVTHEDDRICVIATIEDPEAIAHAAAIVAVPGIDAVFIGRGDLTVALGATSRDDPRVDAAITTIIVAAHQAEKPVCMMVANADEAARFWKRGASVFIISSDQGYLRSAATATLNTFEKLIRQNGGDHV